MFPLLDLLNSRPRRITWFSITIILTARLLLSPIILLLHTTSGYAHLFNFSPVWIAHSALTFAKRFELFWWGKDPRWPGNVTLVLVAILAPRGFFRDVRKHVGPAELFLPCYLAVILPYFSPGFQLYLLPLYPLLVPRLLALLTEHPSTVYPIHLDRDPEPDEIWNYLMRAHASYVVGAHLDGLEFATDPIVDRTLVLHSFEAIPVFSNAHFKIYRLTRAAPLRVGSR